MSKHFDLKFLKENTHGDPTLMAEIIDIFLETTPPMLVDMERFYKSSDWNALKKVAHKLKSNLNTLGIEELSSPIVKVERYAGDTGHKDEIGHLVEKIIQVAQITSKELELELKILRKH